MLQRGRRLRGNALLRRMVRETRISAEALVYPIFIVEGRGICEEITSMPGQYRYSIDMAGKIVQKMQEAGVSRFLLFGIPGHKDAAGSSGYAEDGIIPRAIQALKREFPDIYLIADVCLCEYTSHGHCGVLKKKGRYVGAASEKDGAEALEDMDVDNDATIELLAKAALAYTKAGADMIAPSDMMDGRVQRIRETLDMHGFTDIPIMSYSAKYASAFYGPFRAAADSAPAFGDRRSYQMDVHNRLEAIVEVRQDITEGADIVMVKPGLAYLDIVREVRNAVDAPIAVYSVSGEYAMIKAGAAAGYIDEKRIIEELAVGVFRAGADIYITYFAEEIAQMIREERIG